MYIRYVILMLLLTGSANLESGSSVLSVKNLKVTIENIRNQQGTVRVVFYNSAEKFLSDDSYTDITCTVNGSSVVSCELRLPFGEYAIFSYHDLNENGQLDRGVLQLPVEPTGFSNILRVGMNPPSYEKVKFDFQQDGYSIGVRLN